MRKVACFIGTVFLVVCVTGIANASLVDQGSGVLLDDVAGQYWVQDLSKFNQKTYGEQITAIGAHTETIGNTVLEDWRMADMSDVASLLTAIGGSYDHLSDLLHPVAFLEATRTGSSTTTVWFVGRINELPQVGTGTHRIWGYTQHMSHPNIYNGSDLIADSDKAANYGAWAVMDRGSAVPVPSAILLLASGLLGLAGVSRKKKQ